MIEKHFILDRSIGGPDASFSMEPDEFRQMVEAVRIAENTIGSINYSMPEKKLSGRGLARSLFVVKDIQRGEQLTTINVCSIRPGDGLHPRFLPEVLEIGCAEKPRKRGTLTLEYDRLMKPTVERRIVFVILTLLRTPNAPPSGEKTTTKHDSRCKKET